MRTIVFELPEWDPDHQPTEALVTIWDGEDAGEPPTLALRRGGTWGPPIDAYRDEQDRHGDLHVKMLAGELTDEERAEHVALH